MSKTLLDGVNEVLKRVNVIAGDANVLTNLVDSSRQHTIDIAVQVINEGIDELYSASHVSLPKSQAESTIILVNGQRDYSLASDLVELIWPMIDKTNAQFLYEFAGGYNALLQLDPEQDDTGLPVWGAINPVSGALHLDRAPTTIEVGRVYTYQYEKDLSLSAATDSMPFTNAAFRSMVPAWVQLYKREMKNEFDQALYMMSIGRASRFVTERRMRQSYFPR